MGSMGKRKNKSTKKPTRKPENKSGKKERDDRAGRPVTHMASSGWVQSSVFSIVGAFALLVGAFMTHTQVKSAALVFGIVGTVAVWIIAAVAMRFDEPGAQRDGVRFEVRNSMLAEDAGAVFFLRYPSSLGDTISPMPIAINATVTNLRPVPVSLDTITVAMRMKGTGWETLHNIPVIGNRVYFVYGDFSHARLLDFSKNAFDVLLSAKPLAPNSPTDGWMFFEFPPGFAGVRRKGIQFRFNAKDTEDNQYEGTTKPTDAQQHVSVRPDMELRPMYLSFTGQTDDLTKAKIRDWNTPIPR